jgi:hypothetical protein
MIYAQETIAPQPNAICLPQQDDYPPPQREIGISLPNNQRQHRTLHL